MGNTKARAFFSEKAIRATETEVRRHFMQGAAGRDGGEAERAFSRIGQLVAPPFMRAICQEANRDTPLSDTRAGMNRVLAWMIATSVAAVGDDEERMNALNAFLIDISLQAMEFAASNKRVVARDGAGEIIKGGVQ